MGGRGNSCVGIQHGSNTNMGREGGARREAGAVIRPFAFLDIEESALLPHLALNGLLISCCVYMVNYYIASNSGVTIVHSLRRDG